MSSIKNIKNEIQQIKEYSTEYIAIKDIKISNCNARTFFIEKDKTFEELVNSIKEKGLLNRLLLRKKENYYEIISGYRRLKALETLYGPDYEIKPEEYVILNVDDETAYIISLMENTKRLNLSPLDLNKAYLRLNKMGYKDKDIAYILGVTLNRLKRLSYLSSDLNKIPDKAKEELSKPIEESKFNDLHWDKIRDEIKEDNDYNENMIKDVVDYIIEKEIPPKEVPQIIKTKKKEFLDAEIPEVKNENSLLQEENPIKYLHKGELVLDNGVLKIITKKEEEIVPVEHYLEYLKHPSKFKCFVSFKLEIKPILD
jgi:ParB/RepB/Spo0J family partition protein